MWSSDTIRTLCVNRVGFVACMMLPITMHCTDDGRCMHQQASNCQASW